MALMKMPCAVGSGASLGKLKTLENMTGQSVIPMDNAPTRFAIFFPDYNNSTYPMGWIYDSAVNASNFVFLTDGTSYYQATSSRFTIQSDGLHITDSDTRNNMKTVIIGYE